MDILETAEQAIEEGLRELESCLIANQASAAFFTTMMESVGIIEHILRMKHGRSSDAALSERENSILDLAETAIFRWLMRWNRAGHRMQDEYSALFGGIRTLGRIAEIRRQHLSHSDRPEGETERR